MPITFSMIHDGGYLEIKLKGQISDSELLSAYKSYFNSGNWVPGSNDLTDVSEADLAYLSNDAIRALADFISSLYNENDSTPMKTAIYAPQDLSFGLSRMYEALIFGTAQDIEIFKDREMAIQWL